MPITDAVRGRALLVPVKVANKASEAVNVKIAAGSLPATISSKDLLKLQNAISGNQRVYYTKKIKQERSFLKYLGVTLVGAVATGIGVYVGRSLYKKMVSKTIGKVKSDVFGTAKVAMYNVFGKALEFIKTKFASMIELVKNDFHEILGDKLGAVWDAAKGVFGWVKKIFSWWIKFFLIRFAARTVLTKYGGFSREQAVAMTKPIKFFMSKFFRFPLYFKLFGKFLGYIKDVVVVSGFLSKNFKSKVLDKIDLFKERFLSIVNSDRFQKVKALFEKLGQSKLAQTISEYASKLKGGLKALAETFGKGNTSLKDKIFSFVKSMKESIIAKYVSMRDEARIHNQEKKLRKKEAKDKEAQQAKNERNARTKAALKAKFKTGIFGNQVGSVGAQPGGGEDGGIGVGDIWSLVSSYLGLNYLTKGKIGSIAKSGLNLGKMLFTTRGGSSLLSGGLAAAQGQGVGGTAGAVGGSFAGQAAGGAIGGGLGLLLGGPAGAAAGFFAGEMIGGFIGGWLGKNVGSMIEEDIKKGVSPSAGSAENAMYEAMVKANMVQTKEMTKFDDKNRDKYLGIGSDVVGYLSGLWNWFINGIKGAGTTPPAAVNSPATGSPWLWSPDMSKRSINGAPLDKIQVAMNRMMQDGYTKEQAAGMVGSLIQESQLNPRAINSNSGALGISQLLGSRRADYLKWVTTQKDQDPGSFENQLEWHMKELGGSESKAAAAIRATTTASEAAKIHSERFERPGTAEANIEARQRYANLILERGMVQAGNASAIPSIASVYANCGDAVTKDLNAEMARRGVSSDKLLPTSNLGVGIPQRIIDTFGMGAKVPLDLNSLYAAGTGTAIAYRRQPGDKNYMVNGQIADTHAERVDINPLTGQLGVKSYTAGRGFIWKPLDQNYLDTLPKNASVQAANPFITAGLSPTSQIQTLERQKGLAAAQTQAANTAALQATANAATNLPGEINKNATQTNNIISQTMSSGGKSQGQQINPFEIDDMYILGNMGLALSILNP